MNKFIQTIFTATLVWSIPLAFANNEEEQPEQATGSIEQPLVTAKNFMITTANQHATQTGYNILKQGGSAVDALIASQLVLNLVEPQSSGIGGGGFAVYYDNSQKALTTWDGRETAPKNIKKDIFLDEHSKAIPFYDAVVGGKSVGTPSLLKLLYTLHQRYGKLPWHNLFNPAIKLAEEGFVVSERLSMLVNLNAKYLKRFPETKTYFFPKGEPIHAGKVLTNKPYAKTLRIVAREGITAFYEGEIANNIIKTVQNLNDKSGFLTKNDLKNYSVKQRPPVCFKYRIYTVCGMGPPSSGAFTVNQILGILENFDIENLDSDLPQTWRLIGDATRLAFADRNLYLADSDFITIPNTLLNKKYLQVRSEQLQQNKSLQNVKAGIPPGLEHLIYTSSKDQSLDSTTHINIVDKFGNALAATSSIENAFGSTVMVDGFLLNNQLTDFSFMPSRNGRIIANRIESSKRPRSSMSPTIVFKDQKPYVLIGSAGGSRIIAHVANSLVSILDWQLPINEAINQPHKINHSGVFELEANTTAENLKIPLERIGYKVKIGDQTSGLSAILIKNDLIQGAADQRREGKAMGE